MMTDRTRQGIHAPSPIPSNETEHERLRVLRFVAQELPELAARRGIRVIGKGGTALALADGLTRPSTDYDADTDKPIGKTTLSAMMKQLLRRTPGVHDPRASWSGHRTDPVTFDWRTSDRTLRPASFLNTTVRSGATRRTDAWCLTGPEIKEETIRTVDGMQVYTTSELMRGKASAFMGRAKARDTYDMAWALSTRLKDVDPETRITLDRFLNSGATEEHWKGWHEDYTTDAIMMRANMDEVMETLIDCLEKDPVVRCTREPERGLGFWINANRGTVSLVLAKEGEDRPAESLLEVPRNGLETLAQFILESGADLSQRLNLGPEDIRREGNDGLTRIIESGVAKYERERERNRSRGISG